MAEKKKPAKKTAKPAAKTPVQYLSDKELVLKLEKDAVCLPLKDGFVVFDQEEKGVSLHSGIAKSEADAWKLAAHNL
jgi:hypothetical protein